MADSTIQPDSITSDPMTTANELLQAAEDARRALSGVALPESIAENMVLLLRLVREVIEEYDPSLRATFDVLLSNAIRASVVAGGAPAAEASGQTEGGLLPTPQAFEELAAVIDGLDVERATMLMRAFVTYFHLANVCEEKYRVTSLRAREAAIEPGSTDPINDLNVAFRQVVDECGRGKALALLNRLEFRPVFTAHPTEARRKAVEGKIRRVSELLEVRPGLGGISLMENERALMQEIDGLFRTSPIALKKPTPEQEADTVIDIFDRTLFDMVPEVYRRFDDWEQGSRAGRVPPLCPAFFHAGSWIGSDRDGNPNVTAKVSLKVAERYRTHVLEALSEATRITGRNLTLDAASTPPSDQLVNLWNHQMEMNEAMSRRALEASASELHRAVMLVMASRLEATIVRTADIMYITPDELLGDLRVVQQSLADAGAARAAYGPVQKLIWQVETFGFHMVEMEFRQHSVVHARALEDIAEHGRWQERGELQPMTREVLDTFRAIAQIQRKNGVDAARRYIVSFTRNAEDIANVHALARHAFAHEADIPVLDVIPLFEQAEDLNNAVATLSAMIELPEVQRRLDATGRRLEVMLGYSDSSKDAGPTSATLVLHATQAAIADWADKNNIDLVLMHGRGGAVGRGGGPANRAVLSQPRGSVNCRFKLTEQGEVIFARYGDPTLARRHVESVAGATLLQSAPSIEWLNTESTERYAPLARELDRVSRQRYLELLHTEDFADWFSTVTPLAEIGLLPIGSRPAKRGLGAHSLDDLRAIPWIFSWAQARINLAAWYGLGTACEQFGDLEALRQAYAEWPLFTTFIDNIEMSLSKTDARIGELYLALGDRDELAHEVLSELRLTRSWVLRIVGNDWPLQHRRVLGSVIRMRLPFVNVLSVAQVLALRTLRTKGDQLNSDERERLLYLMLCTVSGVAAGLQNTG